MVTVSGDAFITYPTRVERSTTSGWFSVVDQSDRSICMTASQINAAVISASLNYCYLLRKQKHG